MAISSHLAAFFPDLSWASLFSTQGVMVMLLAAYGGAMWMFLSSAPKVYTIMVSDLDVARQFYGDLLGLPVADIPLHYYYNYEQSLGGTSLDPMMMAAGSTMMGDRRSASSPGNDGLWYQLKKNTQIHVVIGANPGKRQQDRHICFDHTCLEEILLKVQSRRLKYKIRRSRPLNFLVKDQSDRILELVEIKN